jgi:hypothetical protein
MATNKVTSGDYIVSLGPYDSANSVWTGQMVINGNLAVVGNVTYVTDIAVDDAFIIVAANNIGTITSMGLVAQKSGTSWAGLRFNTVSSDWEVSPSVYANGAPITSYAAIFTGSGNAFVAGSNTQIQFNQGGAFGASANLSYDYGNNKLTIQGYEVLGNIGSTPTAPSNAVALYNKAEGAGGTGVYVKSNTADDELISLTKARLYSIIF